MKIIRDAKTLLGMLESGKLNEELSATLQETQRGLQELAEAQPTRSFSATVKLELKLTAKGEMIQFDADIPDVKMPKLPRRSSVFFLVDDGSISTEHPQQLDMIGGPREIERGQSPFTRPA
ncbi:hypothetical protein [Neorhizobium sp. JUb45]|uniref:hypothetical protein n=1 Tax=Neorhizobium sp. JUb45 TaxID=2485113 RepID=UPI00104AE842|nr:hypothetical protein [Neorhizobium sp. JUb45]TCR01090.1 hypothetical protein EDF70_10595 [Neorhizobium sp. JUb45]